MKQKLTLPAWLLALAIFSQILVAILCVHLINKSYQQPKTWALDSTEYYKFKEGQGKLNMNLYMHQQDHEARIRKLDKKRKARYQHIDSLSGDALQREIDSQYNRPGRQPQSGSSPPGQTNPANGSRRSTGTEGQSGPDHAARSSSLPGYFNRSTERDYSRAEYDDSATRQPAAGKGQSSRSVQSTGRRLPDEVARSEGTAVDHSRSRPVIRSREVQTHLKYWQLIQAQGYNYPDIAWALSAVETGYWWSEQSLIDHGNNLFGFKKSASRRIFYVSLTPSGYCRYDNQRASLDDYGDYEKFVIRKYGLHSRADFLGQIHRRYSPSSSYQGKLVLAFQQLKRLKALT